MDDLSSGPLLRYSGVVFLLLVFSLSGCGTRVGVRPVSETAPGPRPRIEAPPRTVPPVAEPEEVSRSLNEGSPVFSDPILESPWARAPGMEEEVQRWIESFQTREASQFRETLVRMGLYREMVEEELRARGLPQSLVYLPIVESWYTTTAVSWVGAVGLWQFMPPTARGFGLQVTRLVDERRDPFRATPFALDFLGNLEEQFDSWFLALAAYNGGPGRLERILRRRVPGEEGHDGHFQEVRGDLPRETRNFIPRFLAAARIGREPEAYGFEGITPEAALAFDEVEVPDATSMDVVARAADVPQRVLESLNPHLLRGLTPAGVVTRIRVPPGTGASFLERYALIPPEERVTFLEHVVASGETLSHIARYHSVPVDDLRAANPRVQPRLMQIGQRIIVPKAPSVRAGSGGGGVAGLVRREAISYTVRSGDTLGGIAYRNSVSLEDLLEWNGLSRDSVIHPGDEVTIYPTGGR